MPQSVQAKQAPMSSPTDSTLRDKIKFMPSIGRPLLPTLPLHDHNLLNHKHSSLDEIESDRSREQNALCDLNLRCQERT